MTVLGFISETAVIEGILKKDKSALQKWHDYQKTFRSKLKSIAKSGEELYYIIKDTAYSEI